MARLLHINNEYKQNIGEVYAKKNTINFFRINFAVIILYENA